MIEHHDKSLELADSSSAPVQERLAGWGNVNPRPATLLPVFNTANLTRAVSNSNQVGGAIARGLGRSYGDSAVNYEGFVLSQISRNRMLRFDSKTGLLTCEAGLSLDEIIQCLLPRGWFLPTTPGTKFVTVGGAIAADVHGKNHHVDGSWGTFVTRFSLLTATGEIVECSREENSKLFRATLGGMGLTGIVIDATIQLTKVATAFVDRHQQRARNLDEALDMFMETDNQYRYSVAWIDCLSRGAKMGRSVLMLANDACPEQVASVQRQGPFFQPRRKSRKIPFNFLALALNKWSIKAFNSLYYQTHGTGGAVVDYDSFFYPLDSIGHWNRIYGRRGFVQYQALLPAESSRRGMRELMEAITESGQGSFLAVLKSSGPQGIGTLSYLFAGHTLALDFPYRGKKTEQLCAKLDQILLEHGGRVYLAKDALVQQATFEAMYPTLDEFKQIKAQWDPQQVFRSAQSDRLGITG